MQTTKPSVKRCFKSNPSLVSFVFVVSLKRSIFSLRIRQCGALPTLLRVDQKADYKFSSWIDEYWTDSSSGFGC